MTRLKIVGLGASMTAGTPGFFSPRERPPHGAGDPESQYGYWLTEKHPEWEFLNRGMRGQKTDQIFARFDYDVTDNHPDVVIILAGTNDLYQGRSVDQTIEGLRRLYARAEAEGIAVVGCTLPPLNLAGGELKEKITEFNRLLTGGSFGLWAVCDVYRVLENPNHPGHLRHSPDDVHPDKEGYRLMGYALANTLEKALCERPF